MLLDRVGLWTATFDGVPANAIGEPVAELDSQGWSSLWFGEAYGREAFTQANLLLSHSTRMRVGTGIANVYGRDALAAAAAARTLHALHPGRFDLGLGISHAPLVEKLRGHNYAKPLTTIREYLQAIQASPALVAGEAELPPVILAALGPKMLDLAREESAGAFPYLVTPVHTSEARKRLGPDRRLIVEQAAVIADGSDEQEWQRRAHDHLQLYTGLDNYRRSLIRQGFDESDLVRGGSLALKRALVPHGLPATVTAVNEHLDAGADEVLVQVLGADVVDPPRADWAALANALR